MKKNLKSIVGWVVVFLVTFVAMALLHQYGTHERGYPAFGGETLLIVFPVILAAVVHDEKKHRDEARAERAAARKARANLIQ